MWVRRKEGIYSFRPSTSRAWRLVAREDRIESFGLSGPSSTHKLSRIRNALFWKWQHDWFYERGQQSEGKNLSLEEESVRDVQHVCKLCKIDRSGPTPGLVVFVERRSENGHHHVRLCEQNSERSDWRENTKCQDPSGGALSESDSNSACKDGRMWRTAHYC